MVHVARDHSTADRGAAASAPAGSRPAPPASMEAAGQQEGAAAGARRPTTRHVGSGMAGPAHRRGGGRAGGRRLRAARRLVDSPRSHDHSASGRGDRHRSGRRGRRGRGAALAVGDAAGSGHVHGGLRTRPDRDGRADGGRDPSRQPVRHHRVRARPWPARGACGGTHAGGRGARRCRGPPPRRRCTGPAWVGEGRALGAPRRHRDAGCGAAGPDRRAHPAGTHRADPGRRR